MAVADQKTGAQSQRVKQGTKGPDCIEGSQLASIKRLLLVNNPPVWVQANTPDSLPSVKPQHQA